MKDLQFIEAQPLSSNVTIRFQDCDPYGHLNNGRYLDYYMNAREDQVSHAYEFDIYHYSQTTGLGWVVTQTNIAYLRPALLMEKITIESQIIISRPKFIQLEMRMFDRESKLKSLLWVQFVHVDIRQAKSIPHSDDLQAVFDKVCLPLEERDFNERVRAMSS
jgi:thioesterase-3